MLVNKKTMKSWEGEILDGIRYPSNIEELWTDAELTKIGLVRVVRFAAPTGTFAVGEPSFQLVDGKAVETFEVENLPPQPDPGPTVEDRLAALEERADAHEREVTQVKTVLSEKGVVSSAELEAVELSVAAEPAKKG